jgi:hypothetical protein
MRFQIGEGALFVYTHQPRVSCDIRRENGREPALDALFAQSILP